MKTIKEGRNLFELREYIIKPYFIIANQTTCPFCNTWILLNPKEKNGCTRMCKCGTKFLSYKFEDGKYYAKSGTPLK